MIQFYKRVKTCLILNQFSEGCCNNCFTNFTTMSKLVLKILIWFDTMLQTCLETLMQFDMILQMCLDISNFEMLWNMHEQALIHIDLSRQVWTCLNMSKNYRNFGMVKYVKKLQIFNICLTKWTCKAYLLKCLNKSKHVKIWFQIPDMFQHV